MRAKSSKLLAVKHLTPSSGGATHVRTPVNFTAVADTHYGHLPGFLRDLVNGWIVRNANAQKLQTINPRTVSRVHKAVRELTEGGVDVAFEAIGTPATVDLAFGLLRRGGRLCVIGYSREPVKISAARLMYYELEIVGSLGCGAGEYPEIMGLVHAGRIRLDPIVSGTLPLAAINDGLDRLRRGEGVRWVVTP